MFGGLPNGFTYYGFGHSGDIIVISKDPSIDGLYKRQDGQAGSLTAVEYPESGYLIRDINKYGDYSPADIPDDSIYLRSIWAEGNLKRIK